MNKKANTQIASSPKIEADYLEASTVREWKDSQGAVHNEWMKVGVAFPHNDGQGYRLVLQSLPVDGIVILRKPLAKPAE